MVQVREEQLRRPALRPLVEPAVRKVAAFVDPAQLGVFDVAGFESELRGLLHDRLGLADHLAEVGGVRVGAATIAAPLVQLPLAVQLPVVGVGLPPLLLKGIADAPADDFECRVVWTLLSLAPLDGRVEPGEPPDGAGSGRPLDINVGEQCGGKDRPDAALRFRPLTDWVFLVPCGQKGSHLLFEGLRLIEEVDEDAHVFAGLAELANLVRERHAVLLVAVVAGDEYGRTAAAGGAGGLPDLPGDALNRV